MDRLKSLPDESVHCVVTSPPYWGLRDYGVVGQIGQEDTPTAFISRLVESFVEVRRVLRKDGTCWINMGDMYASQGGDHSGRSDNQNGVGAKRVHDAGGGDAGNRVPASGFKPKDLMGMPWRIAFALQESGWWLRSSIVWAKPNGMPGSQEDRPTSSYEMVFLLTKSSRYYSDFDAIKTPPRESFMIRLAQDIQAQAGSHRANGGAKTNGPMKALSGGQSNIRAARDKQHGHSRRHAGFNDRWNSMTVAEQQSAPAMMRDVWFIPPASFSEAHFAVMPEELARRCILAGSPANGVILDPFSGAGTTAMVAQRLGRDAIGIELNPEYAAMSERRIREDSPLFAEVSLG